MKTTLLRCLLGSLLAFSSLNAHAFSLIGPYADWMSQTNGYRLLGDIGGPVDIDEEYRWNVPVVTYGFDPSFVAYFGNGGVAAVEAAFKILNDLPPASAIVLTNYSLDTRRYNLPAAGERLDLKSATLSLLLEQLGLGQPTHNVFDLRQWDSSWSFFRDESTWDESWYGTLILLRNFDPENYSPSRYVNGTLFTGTVIDDFWGPGRTDVVEVSVNPLAQVDSAVAEQKLQPGMFFTGLTRDDVGGLRYLLRKDNINCEPLPAGTRTFPSSDGQVWRAGVEKLKFVRQAFNRRRNTFVPRATHALTWIGQNGAMTRQLVLRRSAQPDIVFSAADLGELTNNSRTPWFVRTGTTNWINSAKLNGAATNAGPGIIQGPVNITFHKLGTLVSSSDDSSWQSNADYQWSSFNAAMNLPVLFPSGKQLTNQSLTIHIRRDADSPFEPQTLYLAIPPGEQAVLQISTNQTDWKTITSVVNNGAIVEWLHHGAPESQRFFRAVTEEQLNPTGWMDSTGSDSVMLPPPTQPPPLDLPPW
ncbi:MAG: hypothetical protein ACTHLW_03410 [Verrucomicrobiota bacterium]